jgi:hypothetical protein
VASSSDQLVTPTPHRLPGLSVSTTTRAKRCGNTLRGLVERTQKSATQAREYNETITPDHQENFYLAGMNALAEKFWQLARNKHSDPQEIRTYADLLLRHFEQKHKEKKTAIMERQLALLEEKAAALRAAVSDRSLTDTEFYSKIKEICFPANYGAPTQAVRTAKLLHNGNGFAS